MIKPYLRLCKPGIIQGNLIAAAGGFFLASRGSIDWLLFLTMCLGTICVVASSCAFNNYIDRDIDSIMQRTCQRELVQKVIPVSYALLWATFLGMIGFVTLFYATSLLAFGFALLGFIIYVGFYSLYYKRHSIYGTLIGCLSGACPPVIGYCAVSQQFDIGSAILFLTFCIWQIPHSYAVAIYRFEDYQAAAIPVLPIQLGIQRTQTYIIVYIIAFAIASLTLTYSGYTGSWFALAMGLLSLYWLYIAKVGLQKMSIEQWGKKLTLLSIICITAFCLLISIDFTDTAIPSLTLANLNLTLL